MLEELDKILIEKAYNAPEIKGFAGDYRWLSNFYEIEPFEYDGVIYKTTENFYQAMKSVNKDERIHIASLDPGKAKRYTSPHNKNFVVRDNWDMMKLEVMEFILRRKFAQKKFNDLLLATRDIYIEETNGWGDVFWGCTSAGEGHNNLGLLIMKIRKEIQDGLNILAYKPVVGKLLKKKVKKPTIVVNTKHEKCDVYAGRNSPFGNPFSIYTGEYTLEDSMFQFELEISKKLVLDKEFKQSVLNLTGKKIGCFCKKCRSDQPAFAVDTTPCHAEFYANYLNSLQGIV